MQQVFIWFQSFVRPTVAFQQYQSRQQFIRHLRSVWPKNNAALTKHTELLFLILGNALNHTQPVSKYCHDSRPVGLYSCLVSTLYLQLLTTILQWLCIYLHKT